MKTNLSDLSAERRAELLAKYKPLPPLNLVRQAALTAGVHERTGIRICMGFPTRPAGRERFLAELERLGADMSLVRPQSDLRLTIPDNDDDGPTAPSASPTNPKGT